jgi:fructose PTS system EIIBC or EIIC component
LVITPPPSLNAKFARGSLLDADALIDPELLVPQLNADTKIGAIKELVDRMHLKGIVGDSLSFLQSVLERENLQSTILGGDIALPHARSRSVNELGLALGIARPPIDFPSGDDRRSIHLICLIAVPAHAPDLYLALLAALARTFADVELRHSLVNCTSREDLYHLLSCRQIS